jgi:tellurite resistance protein TerC
MPLTRKEEQTRAEIENGRRWYPTQIHFGFRWSIVWIAVALLFNVAFYRYALWMFGHNSRLSKTPGFSPETAAQHIGLQFLSGYVVEKALSVDNIFVFVVVFSSFGVPALYHRRVLFYGIVGALLFRGIFIAAGSALLKYHWIIVLFGAFLILTGIKMMFAPDRGIEPEKNPVIRVFRRFVPVMPVLHGQNFFVRSKGVLYATPLLLVLLFIEVSDIVFAIDSVPAIFALTRESLVVFTSNILDPGPACALFSARWSRGKVLPAEVWSGGRPSIRRPEDGVVE